MSAELLEKSKFNTINMADTNTQIAPPPVTPEPPAAPALSAEEQLRAANGQPGTKTIPTDEYIQKRDEAKREKKGGIKYQIKKLTKEAAEAKEKLAAIEKNQTIAVAPPAMPVVPVAAPPAVPAPVVDNKPDPRPKREEFADDSAHTQAIAEWVVRQQNKILAVPAAPPPSTPAPQPPKEVQFDPQNPTHMQLKREFDNFLFVGQEFIKRNPDFNDRLNAAASKGLTLDNRAQRTIVRMAAPEVLYYLAAPENEQDARKLMAMDGESQIAEIGKIAERLKVKPSDFVSSAPPPGQHLTNGSTRATIPREKMDPDDYIAMRIQEKKALKFRH